MSDRQSSIITTGLGFGEAPRWHDGRLWFSDFYRQGVFSIQADGSDERRELTLETQPSGLGWHRDGSLIVVSMVDQRVVRVENGVATTFADISPFCGFWANDMVVSESDVAYVGNFGFDLDVMLRDIGAAGMLASPPPSTHLVVLGPDGTILQTIDDMHFPNGSVITPDGQTLIVAETMTFRLTAFSINADGTLRDRRVFAQLDFVAADGICLDAEGQVWVANALAPEVLRVADGGEITEKVTTTQNCFACMLGGGDGQTLFAMTAPSSDRFAIADRRDGCIESVRVEIPGAGRP